LIIARAINEKYLYKLAKKLHTSDLEIITYDDLIDGVVVQFYKSGRDE
jgi:hypothetical protein